jgi:hypothetical protein
MSFDFAAVRAPFRMQPGLHRLASGRAPLTPNVPGARALVEKATVLRRHAGQALVAAPGFDPAPALHALMQQAVHDQAACFDWDGAARFEALALGWSVHGAEVVGNGPPELGELLRALPAASRLPGLLCLALAEDFAVLDGDSARIPWLAVCLPSRWAPEDKVGRHFVEVHAPVADNALLLTAADHLARLVTGADRWERFVWSVSDDARLAQHPRHSPPHAWPAVLDATALAARAHWRTEHQTFIPLPSMRQAVFTILVESRPLVEAVDSPERARQLHDALASMSPSVLAYRGLVDARERLLAWLAMRGA